MDDQSPEAEKRFAERRAWLDANEPPIAPPGSRYGGPARHRVSLLPRRASTPEEWELQRYTLEYLKGQLYWHPAPNTTWEDYAAEAAAASAHEGLSHLLALGSKGDGQAQERLARIAIESTRFLDGLDKLSQEARDFAMRELFWPALHTPFRGLVPADSKNCWPVGEKLLDGFKGLGQHWAALKEATRGGKGVARKWALTLLLEVESARQQPNSGADNYFASLLPVPEWRLKAIKLKSLTADEQTAADWIGVCRLLFKENTGGQAERIPELAQLVKNFQGKRFNRTDEAIGQRGDKRAAIWERVRDSIQTFVGIHRAQRRKETGSTAGS